MNGLFNLTPLGLRVQGSLRASLSILTPLLNRPTLRGNSDDDLEFIPQSLPTPGIEDAHAVFRSAVLIGREGSDNVSPFDRIPHRMVPKVQKAGAYSF